MQQPTEILVPLSALETEDACDATNALVSFVNDLRESLWRDAEIPEAAWELYFADFYVCQVQNGGHSQFFYNAGEGRRADVVRRARAGLARVGAKAQREILDRAVALVARDPSLVERLDEAGYWPVAAEVSASFDELDESIHKLTGERQRGPKSWFSICRAWLRSTTEVERLTDEAYDERMNALADAVPDRAEREAEAAQASEAAMSPFERTLRDGCAARGLAYEGLTAGSPQGDGTTRWSFFASGVRREVVLRGDGEIVEIRWDLPVSAAEAEVQAMLAAMGVTPGKRKR